MTWSSKRQFIYFSIVLIVCTVVVGTPLYFKFFNKTPTCFDGILNQDETGVDCGGICVKVCPNEALQPVIHFERIFQSAKGVYMTLVQLENVNRSVFAKDVSYRIRIYDKEGVLLQEKKGITFMPPSKTFHIIEYGFYTGERIPVKASIFFDNIDWQKGNLNFPNISIQDQVFSVVESGGILKATLKNNEVFDIKKFKAIALLYDDLRNVRETSVTEVSILPALKNQEIIFTWPNISFDVVKSDIELVLLPLE